MKISFSSYQKTRLIKSGSSDLLVDKIIFMVALKITVLWFVLGDSLPKSNIFVWRESGLSNSFLSRLLNDSIKKLVDIID